MALKIPSKVPAVLLHFAGTVDKDDDARTAQVLEQISTGLAVMLAVGVVFSIAMLLGMT